MKKSTFENFIINIIPEIHTLRLEQPKGRHIATPASSNSLYKTFSDSLN